MLDLDGGGERLSPWRRSESPAGYFPVFEADMPNIIVVGAVGRRGKGKVVDLLAPCVDVVVRYQGNNAGHTVVVGATSRVQTIPGIPRGHWCGIGCAR